MTAAAPKINSLAPWFGSNRMLRQAAGAQLGKLAWCGVPFCGGCPELPFIQSRSGLCADLHRHIINLARVVGSPVHKDLLIAALDRRLFHPDELITAQLRCIHRERPAAQLFGEKAQPLGEPDIAWAADYFVCCWMGRGGHAGKKTEFDQGLSLRFTSSGGGSAKRFRSAVESLESWHAALRRWEFICCDVFTFLDRVRDQSDHGLYVDAPWPDAGEEYEHAFTDRDQIRLAKKLEEFERCRIVIRFGDHPFIRELYPASRWRWMEQTSRNQRNGDVREVLILNDEPLEES